MFRVKEVDVTLVTLHQEASNFPVSYNAQGSYICSTHVNTHLVSHISFD